MDDSKNTPHSKAPISKWSQTINLNFYLTLCVDALN